MRLPPESQPTSGEEFWPFSRSGQFRDVMEDISALARREIENARRVLPILARDCRIGYGHCYGMVYDAEMAEDKLRQWTYMIEQGIPRLSAVIRFHFWNTFPERQFIPFDVAPRAATLRRPRRLTWQGLGLSKARARGVLVAAHRGGRLAR